MIITRDLLVQLNACQGALDWLDVQVPTLYGLRGDPFAAALFTARKAEWFNWCKAILHAKRGLMLAGPVERFGAIQVSTPLGIEAVADFGTAQNVLVQRKQDYLDSISYAFSVSACTQLSSGDLTMTPCDISLGTAPSGGYFQAFNYRTGAYTQHPNYPAARAYALARQSEFMFARIADFVVQQQIRNVGDVTLSDWAAL